MYEYYIGSNQFKTNNLIKTTSFKSDKIHAWIVDLLSKQY